MINARAETAATKPAFRVAFRRRRCLVLFVTSKIAEISVEELTRELLPFFVPLLAALVLIPCRGGFSFPETGFGDMRR